MSCSSSFKYNSVHSCFQRLTRDAFVLDALEGVHDIFLLGKTTGRCPILPRRSMQWLLAAYSLSRPACNMFEGGVGQVETFPFLIFAATQHTTLAS